MSSRIAGSLMTQLGPRLFSTAALSRSADGIAAARAPTAWMGLPVVSVRFVGTIPFPAPGNEQAEKGTMTGSAGGQKEEKAVASYWGVAPPKIVKEDGTESKWSCFRPWDMYSSDELIDLMKHHVPITWGDKLARWTVKTLRWPTDIFFQE